MPIQKFLLFASLILSTGAARAACLTPISADTLTFDLNAAETAWNVDELAVRRATDDLDRALPCVGEVLSPDLAARIHRALGLRAWLDRKAPGVTPARLWFAAARRIDPDYRFPTTMVADDDPEQREYVAVIVSDVQTEALRTPKGRSAWVDGSQSDLRPVDWPTIYQLVDSDERPVLTALLRPGESTPGTEEAGARAPRRHLGSWIGGAASIGVLGVGAGLHAFSLGEWSSLRYCGSEDARFRWNGTDPRCVGSDEVDFNKWKARYAADITMMIAGGVGLSVSGAMIFVDAHQLSVGWSRSW